MLATYQTSESSSDKAAIQTSDKPSDKTAKRRMYPLIVYVRQQMGICIPSQWWLATKIATGRVLDVLQLWTHFTMNRGALKDMFEVQASSLGSQLPLLCKSVKAKILHVEQMTVSKGSYKTLN